LLTFRRTSGYCRMGAISSSLRLTESSFWTLTRSAGPGTCCTIACTHQLGFVLTGSPYLHSKHRFDGLCMKETRDYIDAHFASNPDAAATRRCHNQLDNFRGKKGEFHRDGAMWSTYLHGQHRLSPISWWRRFALMSGDLLELAECCLPMPTSIGSSERCGFRARSAIVLSKREPAGWRTCTGHCQCATRHG
jgi:hypothetical protein